MYPFIRLAAEFFAHRNAGPLEPTGTHTTTHRIWPWDLDLFIELNNGRTLTIYDMARLNLSRRTGLWRVLRAKGWGMTVAGLSVRFRKRVRVFQKVESRARMIGWDERFIYLEHAMWHNGECTSSLLVRMAVTDARGMVPVAEVTAALGIEGPSPELPDWVQAWIEAESRRPWPPTL